MVLSTVYYTKQDWKILAYCKAKKSKTRFWIICHTRKRGWFYLIVNLILLQVEKAYEYILAHQKAEECKTDFTITCPGGLRGIYLREPHKLEKPSEVAVTIEPVHYENDISKMFN